MLRAVLVCVLVLSSCGALSAGDEIDARKLLGKWCPKEEATFTVEFKEGGKVALVTTTADGKELRGEGAYKLEGNKLTATAKLGDRERTIARTITKLTDTELVSTDEKGKEKTLVRIKGK